MSKNTRPLNQVFGRKSVMSTKPDDYWPSSTELIGLEIEVENVTGHQAVNRSPYWSTHHDASLRNGIEFVFNGPLGGADLSAALNDFFDSNVSYDCTPRTSIHVHINASDTMGVDDLRAMLLIMYVIEPAVFRWADDNRKYCGYCNPLTDLSPQRLIGALFESGSDGELMQAVNASANSDRYYGFNMASMGRHGTIEFRYFPCVRDKAVVTDWIKFVMLVKKTAVETQDLRLLLKTMQDPETLREFLTVKFGDVGNLLDRHMDYEDSTGRARHLMAAVRTSPTALTTNAIRSNTTRSRGFRAFLEASFPQLVAQQNVFVQSAQTEAEQSLLRQLELYQNARTNFVNDPLMLNAYDNAIAQTQASLRNLNPDLSF